MEEIIDDEVYEEMEEVVEEEENEVDYFDDFDAGSVEQSYADDEDFVADDDEDDYEEDFEEAKTSVNSKRRWTSHLDSENSDKFGQDERVETLAAKLSAIEARLDAREKRPRKKQRNKKRAQILQQDPQRKKRRPKRAWFTSKRHMTPAVGAALRHIRAVAACPKASALLGLDNPNPNNMEIQVAKNKKKVCKTKRQCTYDPRTGHRVYKAEYEQMRAYHGTNLFLMPRPHFDSAPSLPSRATYNGLKNHEWFTANQSNGKVEKLLRRKPPPIEGYPTKSIARSARTYECRCKQLHPNEVRERYTNLLSSGNFKLARAREDGVLADLLPQKSKINHASLIPKHIREHRFLKEWDVLVSVEARPNRSRKQMSTRHDPTRYEVEAKAAVDAALDALRSYCVRAAVCIDFVVDGQSKGNTPLAPVGALEVQLAICTDDGGPPRLQMLHSKIVTRTFPNASSIRRGVNNNMKAVGATLVNDEQTPRPCSETCGPLSWEFDFRLRAGSSSEFIKEQPGSDRQSAEQSNPMENLIEKTVPPEPMTIVEMPENEEKRKEEFLLREHVDKFNTGLSVVEETNEEDDDIICHEEGNSMTNNLVNDDASPPPSDEIKIKEAPASVRISTQVENEVFEYFRDHDYAHLLEYVPVLVADGWDTLETFEQLTEDDALALEGVKRGHAKLLVKIANRLRDETMQNNFIEKKTQPDTQNNHISNNLIEQKPEELFSEDFDDTRFDDNDFDEEENIEYDEDQYDENDFDEQEESDKYNVKDVNEQKSDVQENFNNEYDYNGYDDDQQQLSSHKETRSEEEIKQQESDDFYSEQQGKVQDDGETAPEYDFNDPDTAAERQRELEVHDDVPKFLAQYADNSRIISRESFEKLLSDMNFEVPLNGGLESILACVDLDGNSMISLDSIIALARGNISTHLGRMRLAVHTVVSATNGKYDVACLEQQLFHKYDKHYTGVVASTKFCRALEKLASRAECPPENVDTINELAKIAAVLWSDASDNDVIDYVRWCSWLNPVRSFSKLRRRIARWAANEVQKCADTFTQFVQIHAHKYASIHALTQCELGKALRGAEFDVSTAEARLLRMAYGEDRLKDIFHRSAWDSLVHEGQTVYAKKKSNTSVDEDDTAPVVYQPPERPSSRPSSAKSLTKHPQSVIPMTSSSQPASSPMATLVNPSKSVEPHRQTTEYARISPLSLLSPNSVPTSSLSSLADAPKFGGSQQQSVNYSKTTSLNNPRGSLPSSSFPRSEVLPSSSLASLHSAPKFRFTPSSQKSRFSTDGGLADLGAKPLQDSPPLFTNSRERPSCHP